MSRSLSAPHIVFDKGSFCAGRSALQIDDERDETKWTTSSIFSPQLAQTPSGDGFLAGLSKALGLIMLIGFAKKTARAAGHPIVFDCLTVVAESESLLEQIGCFRKSIGFRNHFLEIAGLNAIGGVVQNLIKNK
jgi:hypothetical protein